MRIQRTCPYHGKTRQLPVGMPFYNVCEPHGNPTLNGSQLNFSPDDIDWLGCHWSPTPKSTLLRRDHNFRISSRPADNALGLHPRTTWSNVFLHINDENEDATGIAREGKLSVERICDCCDGRGDTEKNGIVWNACEEWRDDGRVWRIPNACAV